MPVWTRCQGGGPGRSEDVTFRLIAEGCVGRGPGDGRAGAPLRQRGAGLGAWRPRGSRLGRVSPEAAEVTAGRLRRQQPVFCIIHNVTGAGHQRTP